MYHVDFMPLSQTKPLNSREAEGGQVKNISTSSLDAGQGRFEELPGSTRNPEGAICQYAPL